MGDFLMLDLNEQVDEALGWVRDAQRTIEDEVFCGDPPQPPFSRFLEKLRESERTLEEILNDETFQKMYKEDRDAYNALPDFD